MARWSASLLRRAWVVSARWTNCPISTPAVESMVTRSSSVCRTLRPSSSMTPIVCPPLMTGKATAARKPARRSALALHRPVLPEVPIEVGAQAREQRGRRLLPAVGRDDDLAHGHQGVAHRIEALSRGDVGLLHEHELLSSPLVADRGDGQSNRDPRAVLAGLAYLALPSAATTPSPIVAASRVMRRRASTDSRSTAFCSAVSSASRAWRTTS